MIDSVLIPISLAFDAFAVSICIGICLKKTTLVQDLRVSGSFGFFQFFMPILGWFGAFYFVDYIKSFDHWVAFGLLAFIGVNMIFESKKKQTNLLGR